MIRQIIKINTDRCDGCGICISACHEGALQIIDGKAVLIKDDYCDGLGNCLPVCPQDAIRFEIREAADFDEKAVEEHIKNTQQNSIKNTQVNTNPQNFDIYEQFSMPAESNILSEELLQDLTHEHQDEHKIRDFSQFHTEEPRIIEKSKNQIQTTDNQETYIDTKDQVITNESINTEESINTDNLNMLINANLPSLETLSEVFATPEMQNVLSMPDISLPEVGKLIDELEVTHEPPAFESTFKEDILTEEENPILLTTEILNSTFETIESEFANLDAELQSIDEELVQIDTKLDEEIAQINEEIALIANIDETRVHESNNEQNTLLNEIDVKVIDNQVDNNKKLNIINKIEKINKQEKYVNLVSCEQNSTQIQNNTVPKLEVKSCTPNIESMTKIAELNKVNTHNYTNTELRQWPVQMKLVPVNATYFNNAHILIAADCSAFAYGNFHKDFMRNKVTIIGCPKLDDCDYTNKISEILSTNAIKSVTVVKMEVPCCSRLEKTVITALKQTYEKTDKFLPWQSITIGTKGNIID